MTRRKREIIGRKKDKDRRHQDVIRIHEPSGQTRGPQRDHQQRRCASERHKDCADNAGCDVGPIIHVNSRGATDSLRSSSRQ